MTVTTPHAARAALADPESHRERHEAARAQYKYPNDSVYQCEHRRANAQGDSGDQCPNDAEFEIDEDRFCGLCVPQAIRAHSRRGSVPRRPVIVRYIGPLGSGGN